MLVDVMMKIDLISIDLLPKVAVIGFFFLSGCFEDEPLDVVLRGQQTANPMIPADLPDSGVADDNDSDDNGINVCNPNLEPTWETPINDMMQAQCTSCHRETSTYDAIQEWIDNGNLQIFFEKGSEHFLTSGQEYALRWLEIGAPETDCDVTGKK